MAAKAIAKMLNIAIGIFLCLIAVPILVVVAAGIGVKMLLNWIELHAVFDGDTARRDQSHWKG